MSKHTPGPWTISMGKAEELKDNPTWVLMAPSDDPAFAGTGEPVVFLSFASREDARLIAAAPEMLQTAKLTRKMLFTLLPIFASLDSATGNTNYKEGIADILTTIDLVIAKAEGKE